MRIAVLGSPESWYYRDLLRAASPRWRLEALPFSRISGAVGIPGARAHASVGVASRDSPLAAFDAVIVRTMPPGSLEQVVFRMDALLRLERSGVPVLNPPRAIETAVDKYLTTCRLEQAGLRVPPTVVCQTAEEALAAFEALGRDVVLKPLFGAEGRGIARLQDTALAERAFKLLEQLGAVLYLQRFVPHEGCDLRLLVVGDQVLGMRRRNPLDWRTNISLGGRGEPLEVTPELATLARRAAAAVGAPLAGVDLLPGRDGELYAIEVNAVPGWKALARVTGVDVAALVLELASQSPAAGRNAVRV